MLDTTPPASGAVLPRRLGALFPAADPAALVRLSARETALFGYIAGVSDLTAEEVRETVDLFARCWLDAPQVP